MRKHRESQFRTCVPLACPALIALTAEKKCAFARLSLQLNVTEAIFGSLQWVSVLLDMVSYDASKYADIRMVQHIVDPYHVFRSVQIGHCSPDKLEHHCHFIMLCRYMACSAGWCRVMYTIDDAIPNDMCVGIILFRINADRKSNMQFTKALYVGEASVAKEAAPYNSNQQTHLRVRGAYGPDVSKVKPESLFTSSPTFPENFVLALASLCCLYR
jgi:hypothetical protein